MNNHYSRQRIFETSHKSMPKMCDTGVFKNQGVRGQNINTLLPHNTGSVYGGRA